jgi:hypothetical protein
MSGTADAEKGDPIYMGKVSKDFIVLVRGLGLHPGGSDRHSRWEGIESRWISRAV